MKMIFRLVFFLLIVSLCGCARKTITSTPTSAKIFLVQKMENGRPDQYHFAGISPVTFGSKSSGYWYQAKKVGYEDSEIIWVGKGVGSYNFVFEKEKKYDIFESIPSGADIYCSKENGDLEYAGTTKFQASKNNNFSSRDYIKCTAKYEGYEDETITSSGKEYPRRFIFNLKKYAETIKETISSNPPNAKIYCGSDSSSLIYTGYTTPHTFLKADKYPEFESKYCQVKLDGYVDSEIKYLLKTNDSRKVEFSIEKSRPIFLVLSSNHANVNIYLDDILIGTLNKNTLENNISYGKHRLIAKKDGFKDFEREFIAKSGETYTYEIKLEKIAYGAVKFTSNKNDVDIYIDGEYVGQITELPFVAKLKVGSHTIMAKKELFGAKTIKINIEPYDSISYNLELREAGNLEEEIGSGKIIQSTGELVLYTGRNDLKVTILGKKYIPPATLPDMASGKYKATLEENGTVRMIEIIVKEGGRSIVDLDALIENN